MSTRRVVFFVTVVLAYAAVSHAARIRANDAPKTEQKGLNFALPHGVSDPPSHYQRFRRSEYIDESGFFQWWYFWVRDEETGRHFALDYSYTDCGKKSCENEGSYALFGGVFPDSKFTKIEKYGLDDFSVKQDFTVSIGEQSDETPRFGLTVIDDNTFHLHGRMDNASASHLFDYSGCDAGLFVEWNITVYRKHGWYGQPYFEPLDRLVGVIQWNTYAHDSEVEGTIVVGDQVYTFEKGVDRYRAYGDMNWGGEFPHPPAGKNPEDYPWGWYYCGEPSTGTSIIVGVGLTFADELFGVMNGQFGNIYAPQFDIDLDLIRVQTWNGTGHTATFPLTNDEPLRLFEVHRGQWTEYKDKYGTAQLPLEQTVHIVTGSYDIEMQFISTPQNYNRLRFASSKSVFSDFEALGATASVLIKDAKTGDLIHAFKTNAAGLEFGYYTNSSSAAEAENVSTEEESDSTPSAVIVGGGIGGLTSAHELVERGFKVTVYEALDQLGGKARSFGATGTGTDGRPDLPAEHGFRIFAGEYGATRDTMSRIPYKDGTTLDRMTQGTNALFPGPGGNPHFNVPSHFPYTKEELNITLTYFHSVLDYLSESEAREFVNRLLIVQTSCMERRFHEFENVSWWEFMDADKHTDEYKNLVKLISGSILAANAYNANSHVVGNLAGDMVFRTIVPDVKGIMYMLDGPTSEVWIDPWVKLLKSKGVTFVLNATITDVELSEDKKRIDSVEVTLKDGRVFHPSADVFIAAVPAEKMANLINKRPEIATAAPSLANVHKIRTAWMSGLQFYIKRDVPIVNGNMGFLESPWAIAGVSQVQFRPDLNISEYGNGNVRGVLSMTVSNWTTPGISSCKKPALQCTHSEILAEVWDQMKTWLPGQLTDDDLVTAFLDPSVSFNTTTGFPESNWLPLMINTAMSWFDRPQPATDVENLFVASDYAQTPQNVACMETANEAARLAVNAIIDRMGIKDVKKCEIFPAEAEHMGEGPFKYLLEPLRLEDEIRFKDGKPHADCKCPACTCPSENPLDGNNVILDAIRAQMRKLGYTPKW